MKSQRQDSTSPLQQKRAKTRALRTSGLSSLSSRTERRIIFIESFSSLKDDEDITCLFPLINTMFPFLIAGNLSLTDNKTMFLTIRA